MSKPSGKLSCIIKTRQANGRIWHRPVRDCLTFSSDHLTAVKQHLEECRKCRINDVLNIYFQRLSKAKINGLVSMSLMKHVDRIVKNANGRAVNLKLVNKFRMQVLEPSYIIKQDFSVTERIECIRFWANLMCKTPLHDAAHVHAVNTLSFLYSCTPYEAIQQIDLNNLNEDELVQLVEVAETMIA